MSPDNAETLTPERLRSRLPDGHDEYQFKSAVREIIKACGGNRKAAEGIAIDLVKEETEQRS